MTAYDDGQARFYAGDVRAVLRELPANSVHCCVTSPPYWGLRDYGTAQWEGGDAVCDHMTPRSRGDDIQPGDKQGTSMGSRPNTTRNCHCGARRIDQQLGLEATPEEYVANMVDVFREVRRVLRDDGTLWLNIGDSYAANGNGGGSVFDNGRTDGRVSYEADKARGRETNLARVPAGLKPKDLVGIPWMLAFALRADGWYLRQDIIWAKPNPMPESVTDRCTKAHEYVFLLSKSARYYYDADAVREPPTGRTDPIRSFGRDGGPNDGQSRDYELSGDVGRNKRSVWTIATEAYSEAHFATFPQALVKPCILAGTSEHGVCSECGAPWARVTTVDYVKSPVHGTGSVIGRHEITGANGWDGAGLPRLNKEVTTTGWAPTCKHEAPVIPATVLDPFLGSGTTAMVAKAFGRHAIGIDLNPTYLAMAAKRCAQMGLM